MSETPIVMGATRPPPATRAGVYRSRPDAQAQAWLQLSRFGGISICLGTKPLNLDFVQTAE